jgi:hypothetical protein
VRKRSASSAILAVALMSSSLSATTCVAGKSSKVPRVCGVVTDKDGAVMPDAQIQLTPKGHPEGAQAVSSDKDGRFAIPNPKNGEYEMRVKYPGFWDAWQPFTVRGSSGRKECKRPIRVVMVPAGGCSYVENAWKKSDLKK